MYVISLMKRLRAFFEKNLPAAAAYLILWTGVSMGIFYYTTEMTTSLMPFIIVFLFIYPVITFCTAFRYTKHHGVRWYFYLAATVITAAEYFFLGFDMVEPDYIVMTAVAMFFGGGLGNQFGTAVSKQERRKLSKKERAEREYKNILDD